jgi:hypothetical protein
MKRPESLSIDEQRLLDMLGFSRVNMKKGKMVKEYLINGKWRVVESIDTDYLPSVNYDLTNIKANSEKN